MPGSAQIGNLAVNLSLETAAFQRGSKIAETRAEGMRSRFASAGKSFSGLASVLGVGIGVGALVGVAKSAFDMASALDESAQKMGVTVEALQELNLAATQSGVSEETLAGAMAKLNKSMGALAQGSPQAVAAFAKIGLAADDLKGKSPDQALRLIADALNNLPSVQERVAVGAQIMGKGFSQLLPLINGGSAALDKYAETSRKNGQITTDEAKRLDELSDSWERLKVRTGVAAAKIIATFAEMASKFDAFTVQFWAARDSVIQALSQMATSAVASVNRMVSGIGSAITSRLNSIWEGVKGKVDEVTNAFRVMYDKVVGHSYFPDMVDEIGEHASRLNGVMVAPIITATDRIKSAFRDIALRGIDDFAGAIADVVTGTKSLGAAFKDVARSIISDIIRMVAKMLIFRALSSAFGGIFGGGNAAISTNSLGGSLPGFASGGAGVFGGQSGVDRNILSLNGSPIARVSRGEPFVIGNQPANDPTRVEIVLRDEMLDARIQNGAGQVVIQAAPAIIGKAREAVGRSAARPRLG